MLEGMRIARELIAQEPLRSVVKREIFPGPAGGDLEDDLRRRVELLYHPVGTCRMGTDDDSVVDARAARARRRRPARGRRLDHAADHGRQHERAVHHDRRARGRPRQGPRGRVSPRPRPVPARRGDAGARWRRIWALYDGAYDEIQVQIRERLAGHPHFGPLIRDLPEDDGAGRRQPRAAARGDGRLGLGRLLGQHAHAGGRATRPRRSRSPPGSSS